MASIDCWKGRRFTFEPSHTALLVIDMQRDLLAEDGFAVQLLGENALLRAIMPRVQAVVDWARQCGLLIVRTREGYLEDRSDVTVAKREMGYVGLQGPNGPFLIRGTRGHDFMDGFAPGPNEPVIDKAAFNAFHGTTLAELLKEHAISHLMVAGITTQCCVHSTLRDAVDRGFLCLTIEDGCAAIRQDWHDATMTIIQSETDLFGWIAQADDVINALGGARAMGLPSSG